MTIPLLFAGVLQALFLGVVLLLHRRGPVVANRLMGALLLSIAAEVFIPLQYFLNGWSEWPHLVLAFSCATFLNGPLLFFYVRQLTAETGFPGRLGWLHFLPALINLLILLPTLTLPSALLTLGLNNPPTSSTWALVIPVAKIVSLVVYLIYSVYLLREHRRRLPNLVADVERNSLTWVMVLVGWALLLSITLMLMVVAGDYIGISDEVIDLTFAGGLAILVLFTGFMSLRQPEVFSGQLGSLSEKSARSLVISPDQVESCLGSLAQAEEDVKFFLDPEITIHKLARLIEVPAHHLSHVINTQKRNNFFGYINQLRIAEVKRQLHKRPDKSILYIALEAGFNNKTTFNKAFKAITGTTPSEYRKQVRV